MKLRALLIEKLGGYTEKGYRNAEEAIAAVEDPKEKRRLLTLAVTKCFSTIGPEDILKGSATGEWRLGEKTLSAQQRDRLIAEAAQFERSLLWRVLKTDIRHQANKATFLTARSEDELTAGKLWLWTLDAFKTRLKSMAKGSGMYNSEPHKK